MEEKLRKQLQSEREELDRNLVYLRGKKDLLDNLLEAIEEKKEEKEAKE